ncbi:carboxymuconolactone decarboxylase family protein [Bordetella holmesii]|uniref:Carboxymuconolactone decarboxylase family protein n=4 Tax=Bordetella holmesii TaxID=35814 RepID=A0A158M2H3_9BORD|nr:carboxymuconolactone decarboxylase family protein [Bordetella holmesii]AHV94808.1 carboxymuconolactone decarboxylase family protein [Bordetella holmesii ATCC 51541]AIT28323.1 carboxymuconolactone decarboxylase family protein [Bordetella holmesii 44057]EWM41114.1 carboxymuconolactone decarboxylase family protein [Bordetella holmesii 35009]EWM41407.1 carboxymuconolactone decarboxylase family protein [Bordetella holmesii 41130]EWM45002.1 carboxymuconolactone decarboxylase family protein [Borde
MTDVSRLAPVAPGSRPELAALEARIQAARGRISPLYQVLLNSAPICEGWEAMLSAVRNRNSLPARLRELVILRVAILNRAPYEFEAHVPHVLAAGVAPDTVQALRVHPAPADIPGLHAGEAEALAYTDAMTRDIEVSDPVFEPLRGYFDEQGLLDLTATVAAYNMVSRLLVALRVGH